MSNFIAINLTDHAINYLTGSTVKNTSLYSVFAREFPCSKLRYFSPTFMVIFKC